MLESLWLYIVKNWKTTVSGVVAVLVWFAKGIGLEINSDTAAAISSLMLAVGAFFAKDGDKSGLTEEK